MIRIRSMRREDLARVGELSVQLGYPVAPGELQRRFDRLTADPGQALLVAERESDGAVCGWIHVHPRLLLETGDYAEIGGLVVDATARRSGAGRALVQAAVAWARERGFPVLRVRSNAVRPEAHAFYPAVGFSRSKTQHVYEKRLGGGDR